MTSNECVRDDGDRHHLERICKKKYKKSIPDDGNGNGYEVFESPNDILEVSLNENPPELATPMQSAQFFGKPKKSKKKKHHKRKHGKPKSSQALPVDNVISMDTFTDNACVARNVADDDDGVADEDAELMQQFQWSSSLDQAANNDNANGFGASEKAAAAPHSTQMTLQDLQEKYRYLDELKTKRKHKKHKHLKCQETPEERAIRKLHKRARKLQSPLNDEPHKLDPTIPTALMAQGDAE